MAMVLHSTNRLPIRWGWILVGVLVLILAVILINRANSASAPYTLSLAGEQVPFDQLHQFNIERYERELAINQMNESQLQMIWKRLPLYQPYIQQQLSKAGIPTDIFYLAVAESALRENAVSTANAVGIWQFIGSTAKEYGLRVDDQIDERYDLVKSTDAAIRYLQNSYKKFNNWTLAMASYNRGVAGLSQDMAYQYQQNYYDLYLNNETYRYIFRILALKEIFENLETYVDTSAWGSQYSLPETKTIRVNDVPDLALRAKTNNYTYLEIRNLNPWIRSNSLPQGQWDILVYER